jgi:prolyl-tRNA synthetase
VRLGLGQRDLAAGQVEVARRDTKEKANVPLEGIANHVEQLLNDIQANLFNRAKTYRDEHITKVDNWDQFVDVLENKGGFAYAHWDGTTETEKEIKEKTKATIRCLPLDWPDEAGTCILSGKPSQRRVLFAKAY